MAIFRFWLNPFCEDRSKTGCWVSIIGSILLQSEIQILSTKRNESLTERAYSQIEQGIVALQIPPGSTESEANNHSETPRNQLAPWRPKTGYIHEISGPLLINGDQRLGLIGKPFLVPKKDVDDDHRCRNQVIIKVFFEKIAWLICLPGDT